MPRTLLIVDDSITIHRVIELTLAGESIDVVGVTTRSEALDRLTASGADIILADIGRPEPDGCALAVAVKGDPRFARIPIVLLTSALEPLEPARMAGVPHDAVLAKPFDPGALIDAITRLLESTGTAPATTTALVVSERGTDGAPVVEDAWPASAPLPPAGTTDPLDAYFDRLDAAFADLRAKAPYRPLGRSTGTVEGDGGDAPRQGDEPDALAMWDPELGDEPAVPSAASARDPFAGLLASEQARRRHAAPSPVRGDVPVSTVPDEVIDQIVDRVMARMDSAAMRRIVLDTAERLVRDEIERIKRADG